VVIRLLVSWLESNIPFQHKYGYIREILSVKWVSDCLLFTIHVSQ